MFIALCAVSLMMACRFPTDSRYGDNNQNCGDNSSQQDPSCTPNHHSPSGTVISVGPAHQYTDNADTLCYQFSPMPASVTMGGDYYFQNNTSSSVTILGSNQVPWVTVAAGATSPPLNFSTAGVYNFGVQGCRGVDGTPSYGVLDVTLN
jgi:hypothetical protein